MSKAKAPPQRTAMLVLGMHRSGTSLLSGLLAQAGVNLGLDLMEAAADNPKGFWENQRIVDLHEQFLNSLGHTWSSHTELPRGWESSPEARAFEKEMAGIVADEFADSPLIGIKDPRLCRLLPLWRGMANSLDIALHCISIIRPADEVIASLQERDGIGDAHGRALWLRYNLEWELYARGLPQLRTCYEAVLAKPDTTLAAISELCGTDLQLANGSFADASLRHHRLQMPEDWSSELYHLLESGSEEVPRIFHLGLARLASELAESEKRLNAGGVDPTTLSADALQSARESLLFEQAQDARRHASTMERELETGRAYIAAMEQELQERQSYAKNLEKELAARDADISDKSAFISSLEEHQQSLEAELDTRKRYIDSLNEALVEKDAELVRRDDALAREQAGHREFVAGHEKFVAEHEADIARREEYTQSLIRELESTQAELEATARRLEEELYRFRHLRRIGNLLKGKPYQHDE